MMIIDAAAVTRAKPGLEDKLATAGEIDLGLPYALVITAISRTGLNPNDADELLTCLDELATQATCERVTWR